MGNRGLDAVEGVVGVEDGDGLAAGGTGGEESGRREAVGLRCVREK